MGKFIETGSRLKVPSGWGEGKLRVVACHRVCIWNDEKVLEIVVTVVPHCEYN